MATLHKFKILATQCAVAGSPTHSPTTSPVIHLRRRRRKTLKMLLSRPDRPRLPLQDGSPDLQNIEDDEDPPPENVKEVKARRKLKDLFVSSPPIEDKILDKRREEQEELLPATGTSDGIGTVSATRRSLRTLSGTFRYRLLRRAWRPVLVTIPE